MIFFERTGSRIKSGMTTASSISNHILSNFDGLSLLDSWGEKSFFYNPNNLLPRGIYFCTIKEKDGANDKASDLNRDGIFRVNFGISKQTFLNRFHLLPKRPSKGNIIDGSYDFKALDVLTPHPIYGWMAWVSILNPSHDSWNNLQMLLAESYKICIEKYNKRSINS